MRLDERRIEGIAHITLTNPLDRPLERLPLGLYPDRYGHPNPTVKDYSWNWLYPGRFVGGGIHLPETFARAEDGTFGWLPLPAPVPPGGTVEARIPFRVDLPARYGVFGVARHTLVVDGGWHPYPLPLRPDGSVETAAPPDPMRFLVHLRCPGARSGYLNGRPLATPPSSPPVFEGEIESDRLSLVLYGDQVSERTHVCPTETVRWVARRGSGSRGRRVQGVAHAVADSIATRMSPPPDGITILEVPIRHSLAIAGADCVFVSDRLFEVHPVLERYHQPPLAAAIAEAWLYPHAAAREAGVDRKQVAEILAWDTERRALSGANLTAVKGTLESISFIPYFDRLLRAPDFPFHAAYYDDFAAADPFRDEFLRHMDGRGPGRLILERLRDREGDDRLAGLIDAYLAAHDPFEVVANRILGPGSAGYLAQYVNGPPPVNYALAKVASGPVEGAPGTSVTVEVRRETDRPLAEPVEIVARDRRGNPLRWVWDGPGDARTLEGRLDGRLRSVEIDPRRRLRERTRTDNRRPRERKLLLNRYEVSPDPNRGRVEFDVATTLVLGGDYSETYHLNGFRRQEANGGTFRIGRAFGPAFDLIHYAFGASLSVTLESLRPDFVSRRSGRTGDRGEILSFGLGLGTDTRAFQRNPTRGFAGGIGIEVADDAIGGDFDFRSYTAGFVHLIPLDRRHTLALRAAAGYLDGPAPAQRLFDAGGEVAVRGLRRGSTLGETTWSVGMEWRHDLATDLDWRSGRIVWYRRLQGAFSLDAGNATDDHDDSWDLEDAKASAGYGLRLGMDLMGASPTSLSLDAAHRIDRWGDEGWLWYLGVDQTF